LTLDAVARGWDRDVERHRCTSQHIENQLTDLGQSITEPEDGDAAQ